MSTKSSVAGFMIAAAGAAWLVSVPSHSSGAG
jgi:hypothetical protein